MMVHRVLPDGGRMRHDRGRALLGLALGLAAFLVGCPAAAATTPTVDSSMVVTGPSVLILDRGAGCGALKLWRTRS
jgi:hypothetical protein